MESRELTTLSLEPTELTTLSLESRELTTLSLKSRKLTTLTLKVKRELCHYKQTNQRLTLKELQAWVEQKHSAKVHEATISRVLKKSYALLSSAGGADVKRRRNATCPAVEEALYKWVLTAQEGRIAITDDILMEKGKQLHAFLVTRNADIKECKFSNGWLVGFKRRHNISLRALHGKGDSVLLTGETWDLFTALKATLSSFEACDVFNLDETGIFYELQPSNTSSDAAIEGQKKDEARITVGLCANMDASMKMPPLIISKARSPQAFSQRSIKRPDNLGISWYSNARAWMKGEIFQDWVLKFENCMKALGRKQVALLVDNAPGHLLAPIADQLQITKVLFLPANTTARFQPMDAGIIRSFKLKYRSLFIRRQLSALENCQPFNLDIYDAVTLIVQAWTDGVTADTIRNCWRHCDLVPHKDDPENHCPRNLDFEARLVDTDLVFQMDELGKYLAKLSFLVAVDLTVDEYIASDSVENAPTFSVEADLSDFLVDRDANEDQDTNQDQTVVDSEDNSGSALVKVVDSEDNSASALVKVNDQVQVNEQVETISYGVGMAHFESLKMFFEQQEYDTTAMTAELNRMIRVCTEEHLKSLG